MSEYGDNHYLLPCFVGAGCTDVVGWEIDVCLEKFEFILDEGEGIILEGGGIVIFLAVW